MMCPFCGKISRFAFSKTYHGGRTVDVYLCLTSEDLCEIVDYSVVMKNDL